MAMTNIPVISPDEIPMMVSGGDNWRERYDALRERYPFFRVGDDPTIWFTRYDACREIMANAELFWKGPLNHAGGASDLWDGGPVWDQESAEREARRHIAVRQALMPKYGPLEVARWEGRIREVCTGLIERFQHKGEADFVVDFARYFFPYIGCEMVGLPEEDWDQMVEWQHEVFKVPAEPLDPAAGVDQYRYSDAMAGIIGYLDKMTEQRRGKPDDTFIGHVLKAEAEGVLTEKEGRWAIRILTLGSGHTVTSHLGYVFKELAERPDLQARVQSHPEQINAMCEEILRLNALFGHTRTATEDMEFHGCKLSKGDTVFVCYTMPNRDPRVAGFDHEDLERKVNRHLSLNQGWRQCMGLHFARKARLIAVEEWHRRIPEYRIKPGARLAEQVYAGVGYHELPFVWKA
jgi:cytochrome P450